MGEKKKKNAVVTDRELRKVQDVLRKRGELVTTVESLTAGMISARLADIPGSSDVLKRAFVTYCDEAKHEMVGVKKKTLKKWTAVSRQTAKQMAKDAGNQLVGDAIANIAANDTARKDNIDASYRATDRQLAQQQIGLEQQRGQNIANAASQIGSSLMSAATSYLGTNFGAGSPGGGGVTAGNRQVNVTAGNRLTNMGGGNYTNFSDYANNYVKNMYLPETYFTHKSPLFSMTIGNSFV